MNWYFFFYLQQYGFISATPHDNVIQLCFIGSTEWSCNGSYDISILALDMRGQPCRSYEGNDPNILLSYSTYHIVYIAHSFAAPTHAIMLVYEGVASEVVRSEGVAH
jgi:hypothetical protein